MVKSSAGASREHHKEGQSSTLESAGKLYRLRLSGRVAVAMGFLHNIGLGRRKLYYTFRAPRGYHTYTREWGD